jgi:hypothetical protein
VDKIVTLESDEGISWKEVAVVAEIYPQTICNMLSGKFLRDTLSCQTQSPASLKKILEILGRYWSDQ